MKRPILIFVSRNAYVYCNRRSAIC